MTTDARALDLVGVWCAQQIGATCDNPFGPQSDVYRVGDKIFALVNRDDQGFVTVKATPDDVLALRQANDFIRPGYYMNKRHWITVDITSETAIDLVRELIDESHLLVLGSLTKARQAQIAASKGQ